MTNWPDIRVRGEEEGEEPDDDDNDDEEEECEDEDDDDDEDDDEDGLIMKVWSVEGFRQREIWLSEDAPSPLEI